MGNSVANNSHQEPTEEEWESIITDALLHGWVLTKQDDAFFGGKMRVEPPEHFTCKIWPHIYKVIPYRGYSVEVSHCLTDRMVRHTGNRDEEENYEAMIEDALQHGWCIQQDKSGHCTVVPPLNSVCIGWCAIWHKKSFRGRVVSVPNWIDEEEVRHTGTRS